MVAVDDGSTDATPAVLAGFGDRIRVVRKPNGGLSSARNAGIDATTTGLLGFLDADDLLPREFAASMLAAAAARPDVEVFHCGFRAFDRSGALLYYQDEPLPLDDDPFHRLVWHGSPHITALAVRRTAVDRAGRFDESLKLQEDWDYWLRLAAAGCRFAAVPATSTIVRRRGDSMSAAAGERLGLTGLAVLERHLARHGRCPACRDLVDPALEIWRRSTVNSCSRAWAQRLHLRGAAGAWIGRLLAVVVRPRLLPGLLAETRARFARG